MKKLLFTFLAITLIFAACEKEEEPTTNNNTTTPTTYAFSCKIDGVDFTDNSPEVSISNNVFTLDAISGDNTIRIIIHDFSNRNEGEEISLDFPNGVYVTMGTAYFTNTQSGKLTFSEIVTELSAEFNFKCNNLQTFEDVTVTEGAFTDLAF